MILRTAGGKAKNGITSCHARRQEGAIDGVFLAPFGFEICERFLGLDIIRGLINPLQIIGDGLAILPAAEVQGMAHQMHDAGLDRGLGKSRV